MNNRTTRAASIFDFNFRAVHLAQATLKYTAELYAKLAEIPAEKAPPGVRIAAFRTIIKVMIESIIERENAAGNGAAMRPLRDLCAAIDDLQIGITQPLLRTSDELAAGADPGADDHTVIDICAARRAIISPKYRL
jgi:hypothetical protein